MVKRRFDWWQVSLLSAIMLMLVVVLGFTLWGQAAYAWSPGAGQNVVVDNGYSFSGKDTKGNERPMLTLINTNAIRVNGPPAGAIFFTIANTEMMRISNAGNVGIGDTTPTEGRLVVQATSGQGVYAYSADGDGITGNSENSYGVYGNSTNSYGVAGYSMGDNGVNGFSLSATGNGVEGICNSGTGVRGSSTSGAGVYGESTSGYGVHGHSSSSYAGYFDSRIKINGPIETAYRLTGINATVTATDSIIAVNSAVAPLTVTLSTAVGIAGRQYIIKKVDGSANAVTVACNGSETIDGAATYSLAAQWKYITVVSNGSNWLIVANN